jgi:hypothetical protein
LPVPNHHNHNLAPGPIFGVHLNILKVAVLLIVAVAVISFVAFLIPDNKDNPSINPETPAPKADSPTTAERPETPKLAPNSDSPMPPVDPAIVSSLESTPLPVMVITTEIISLLNETGKETQIPAQTTIRVLERANLGSLEMEIGGKTFVGNESRLTGKARFVGK